MTSSASSCFIFCLNSKLRLFQGMRVLLDGSVSPLPQAVSLDSGSIQLLLPSVPETQIAAWPAHSVLCQSKLCVLARPHSMILHSLCSVTLTESHLFWLKVLQLMQRPLLSTFLNVLLPFGFVF